jgi:RNA polymerase subunit RPABC4/transcription elongation factor Spt4
MGLFDRFRSSGLKWECNTCGAVHESNVEKCSDCEGTVFTPIRSSSESSQPSTLSTDKSSSGTWACAKCGHFHDRKPFTCDECNSSALRSVPELPENQRTVPGGQKIDTGHNEQPEFDLFMAIFTLLVMITFLIAVGYVVAKTVPT